MSIVVLSLNTAIDRTVLVRGFAVGKIYRTERSGAFAGGKGLNVARVLRQLGGPVRVIGFLGGVASPFIRDWCSEMGIEQRWVDIVGETRTCVIVVDPESGVQTVVNETGPRITPDEIEGLREEIAYYVLAGDILCISGSAPPGVPDDFYGEIASEVGVRGVRVMADLSGAELESVGAARPWALSPNLEEATSAFGLVSDPVEMARRLASHAEHGLLTLGARGVLYASGNTTTLVRPPAIDAVNAVASGDAFVAGFVAGCARGVSPIDAVRLGVACGASNAARFEPGIGSLHEVEELMGRVEVEAPQR